MRLNAGERWRLSLAVMVRLRDRGMANGWPVKLTDVLGDDENSLAEVHYLGEDHNLCGFSRD